MASDITILVADPRRLPALRAGLELPGRVLRYSSSNLASAFESIRALSPRSLVLDAVFADTPEGHAFIDRIEQLAIDCEHQIVAHVNGSWSLSSVNGSRKNAPPIGVQ